MSFSLLLVFSKNVGKLVHGTAIEMAGISTGKNNASAMSPTIEKADAGHKRDLFGRTPKSFL
jgi:hypothetical protein